MKIYHGMQTLHDLHWPVATLGTFDGVHLGHQKIIGETIDWAREHNGEAIVVTFSIPPRIVTTGKATGFITSLSHRLALMERLGIDIVMVIDFDRKFAEVEAEDFVHNCFCDMIHTKGVVVGFNNRFGKGRRGDFNMLREIGPGCGFEARRVEPVLVDGEVVSSTAIREAISKGDLDRAAAMLGRRVSMMGTVVGGEGRGRTLGFPTANLDLHHETCPAPGVYACYTTVDDIRYKALASIGSQPTFHAPESPVVVEVYIHDFNGDLYGKELEVVLVKRLRGQIQFKSSEELIAKMWEDVERLKNMPE